jgi:hypothetical protein
MSAFARGRLRELASVALGFSALAIACTYPLAFKLSSLGRTDNADGQFAIWNVAWVARTLVVDPLHVFDANIFYPHRWTLAYSEANLGAGPSPSTGSRAVRMRLSISHCSRRSC